MTEGRENGDASGSANCTVVAPAYAEGAMDGWRLAAKTYVNQKLYNYVQFVGSEDLTFGSQLQKEVCDHIRIRGRESQCHFWLNGGASEVHSAIKRKRQTLATAMKRRFESKLRRFEVWVYFIALS